METEINGYEVHIEVNPDQYSEADYLVTVCKDGTMFYESPSFSKDDALEQATKATEKLTKGEQP